MKFLNYLIIALLSLTLISCSKNAAKKANMGDLPNWVVEPNIPGKISAVGIAPKSAGGVQFQIPQAEADARANIAAILNTKISRLTKSALSQNKVEGQEQIESVFSQTTKNVVKNVPLKGAKRVNIFKDPSDGSLYIQMAIDSEMISKYLDQQKKLYKKAIRKQILDHKDKKSAKKAVNKIYNDLDKELKND
jgi:hypothetical protein